MRGLVRGGLVVRPSGTELLDVEFEGGSLTRIEPNIAIEGHDVIDASGLLVLPGVIDAHTHMEWPGSADDFRVGTEAAALGGVTTIIDFCIQYRGATLRASVDSWKAKADPKVVTDYSLHVAISDFSPAVAGEIRGLVDEGITSFKMWMTSAHSGGLGVDDGTIVAVMEKIAASGGLVGLHCENDSVIGMLNRRYLAEGKSSALYHRLSHPPYVEAEAIRRAATFAEATGCLLYIPHLSSGLGREAVIEARRRKVDVVAETCPQFLALTDSVYARADAAHFVMSPPIKGPNDQEALWKGLVDGDIATMGSDHCPYDESAKALGSKDFTKIPNGVASTEVILAILHGQGVIKNRLTIERMVEVTSELPARLFGLFPKKGCLCAGSDADLVLFDPRADFALDAGNLHSNLTYSIYQGLHVQGRPVMTLRRGEVIASRGALMASPGSGQFIARQLPDRGVFDAGRGT